MPQAAVASVVDCSTAEVVVVPTGVGQCNQAAVGPAR